MREIFPHYWACNSYSTNFQITFSHILPRLQKHGVRMKILITLIVTISSFSLKANEIELSFTTKNLDHKHAHLKITMESSNALCTKVVVGIGGIAIGNRYQFINGQIESNGNRLVAKSQYKEGGFCHYRLSEIYLYFLNEKNTYFETRVSILDKKEWSGGGLDHLELSTNLNNTLAVTCEGKITRPLSSCVTTNNGEPRARGNSGSFYIWRDHLRGVDQYEVGELTFIKSL